MRRELMISGFRRSAAENRVDLLFYFHIKALYLFFDDLFHF